MNFNDYIGKPIVLITNEVNSQIEINDISLPGNTFLVHSFGFPKLNVTGGKFCIVRNLRASDLEDEDFSTYLKNMWKDSPTIDKYLRDSTVIEEFKNTHF